MQDYEIIRRKFLIEKKSQRQIAKEMNISRNTVAKYCQGNCYLGIRADYQRNASIMTPDIIQFIQKYLHDDELEPNKKQHHTAKRIFDRLVDEIGFCGAQSTVRGLVHKMRSNLAEAFVPLKFNPGDAMQIDWGECYVWLADKRIKVNIFCARLCYSCAPFVICFRKQNTQSFIEGLIQAFAFFNGVPRRVIFDNARVAVKKGTGKHAICQESYAALAAHYCFETIFCNVRSGNEKGLVENLVGLTRRNMFVPVPHIDTLEALNKLVKIRCQNYINTHKVISRQQPVKAMLLTDQQHLLALPMRPYDASQITQCRVSSYSTIRFSTNTYSVPVKYTGQTVAVKAHAEFINIYINGVMIASHIRNYRRNQQILQLKHYLPLLERKPRSILHAKPVHQSLSSKLMNLLRTTTFTDKELINILTLCVEKGEPAFWQRKGEFLTSHTIKPQIKDTVLVQPVNLVDYDQLYQKGAVAQCKIQV